MSPLADRLLRGALILAAMSMPPAAPAQGEPLPQPGVGRIERLAAFASRHVPARHVDVWLPPGYPAGKPYTVLYMHDGQMLYDARTTWNHQAWNVQEALVRGVREGRIPHTLVVGIWNQPERRYAEYYPEKFLALADEAARREYVEKAQDGRPQADAYLRFIVEELKPAIDARYPTRTGPEGTFVMGSSMGGLISWYALCEYPHVFGGAAGLSTHWVGRPTAWGLERVRNAALPMAALHYLERRLPPPGRHRLYTDRGDDALERLYAPAQSLLADLLHERGYDASQARTRVFEGTGHNERDWGARLDEPLRFLLGSR